MRGRGPLRTRALAIFGSVLGTVLAVQGNYSVAKAQGADRADEQTALAVPRIQLHGAAGVGIPQPLAPSEANLIRRIFVLQAGTGMAEAVRDTGHLVDGLLLGTILADRYLRPAYHPTPAELTAWLARFGDQPEAAAIRTLLERLAPAAAADDDTPGRRQATGSRQGAGRAVSEARLRSQFVHNRDAAAVADAQPLLTDGARGSADARLTAGLAAWRQGQFDTAFTFFAGAYDAAKTPEDRAAGAYWAGRAELRRMNRGGFAVWMRRAALEGDTFYAMIAHRALGPAITCRLGQTIGDADVEAVLATPEGRRVFALLQVGEKYYAQRQLRALWVASADQGLLDRPIALIARAVGFTQLAAEVERNGGAARRPAEDVSFVRLHPAGGFLVDPALVYALVRHESNFHVGATSHSGARGLMQIMPRTAHAVAGRQAAHLQDPSVNLAIGQRLMLTLAADDAVDGDLIRLLAGYAQGQGGLRRWVDAVHADGDPLLFIEAIPNPHTREFVQDALLYSWQYAAVLHLLPTSLDELAHGRYPRLERAGAAAAGRADGKGACTH